MFAYLTYILWDFIEYFTFSNKLFSNKLSPILFLFLNFSFFSKIILITIILS